MKHIYILFAVVLLASGCSSTKQLQKAINRHGQVESINYIMSRYAEYIPITSIPVPLIVNHTDTFFLPQEYLIDTVDLAGDSVAAENKYLKTRLKRLNGTLWLLQSQSKTDTFYINHTDTIIKNVPAQYNVPKVDKPKTWWRLHGNWLLLLLLALCVIVILTYFIIRKRD